jgi:signal transduction histidine kinase/ligand-binding sensor domain-containing protein
MSPQMNRLVNLLFIILPISIFAQDLLDNEYNAYYYSDYKNNLWVSSSQGWNRYNGSSTTQFKSGENGDILGKYIQCSFHEDKSGYLWTSTYEYLVRYDPQSDGFESLQIEVDGKLINDFYYILEIDKEKNLIWLRSGEYLLVVRMDNIENDYLAKIPTKGRRFTSYERSDTTILIAMPWAEGLGCEVIKYHNGNFLGSAKYLQNPTDSVELRDGMIIEETFWGCSKKGLINFNIDTPEDYQIFKPSTSNSFYPHHVALIDSFLFITSKDQGLWKFDFSNKKFINQWTKESGLKNDSPMEIFIQDTSLMWLSYVGEGVQSLSLKNNIKIEAEIVLIGENSVDKIFRYQDSIIISVNGIRIEKFSLDKHLLNFISPIIYRIDQIQDAKMQNNLLHIVDKNTYVVLDIDQNKMIKKSKLSFGQSNFIDKSTAQTKFLSTTVGIFPIDSNLQFTHCDSLRNVMFYTKEKDTYIVNKSNEVLICNQDTVINLGQHGWPVQMTEDTLHNMLLATNQGLFKIKDEKISPMISSEFLLDDIKGFSYDDQRNLWFTRTKNIYVYTADSTLIRIPSEQDIEFSNSAPIFPNNEVWFATNKGVLTVSNEIYKEYQETPNIFLMEVFINGLKYDSPFNPDYIENMDLIWRENDLNFRTEVGEYTGDKHQSLKYILKGNDQDWTYTDEFTISYKNLQPGNYTLEMVGIGSNLRESKPKKIVISISAPFYQTWWFRGTVAGALVLMGFGINYVRTKKKLREQQIIIEKQKALQNQRNRMAQDLHDEMGSGLTTIKYISNALKKDRDSKKIDQIEETSTDLIGSMRDLLWSLDESNDTLGNLLSRSRTILHHMCKNTCLKYKVTSDITEDKSILGIHRRNIILIIKEGVTNVIKHAKANNLELSYSDSEENLILHISDDGIGIFHGNETREKSYGIKSIEKRVQEMNGNIQFHKNQPGTRIEISIPLSTL